MQREAYLPIIPYGHCQCGCGQKATIATASDRRKGIVRGRPNRYLKGHHTRSMPACYSARPVGDALLPVFGDGELVAHARVDASDWDVVTAYRWRFNTYGYVRSSERDGGTVLLHRLVLRLAQGDGEVVDHVNGDKLDNRRSNLRPSTPLLNAQNRSPISYGSSRYRGVCWAKSTQKWQAQTRLNGQMHYLGQYENERDAVCAVVAFRAEHMPHSRELAAID